MKSPPSTPDRCKLVLNEWRKNLSLSNLEKRYLAGELKALDKQLNRLIKKKLKVAVFGRVGVGKSSLLNALLEQDVFATDVAHGCTRHQKGVVWEKPIKNLETVELIDTPGIDEIDGEGRSRLAARISLQADLIIMVLDSDLTLVEFEAINNLLKSGKPFFIALNRCDQWTIKERSELLKSIRNRLPIAARHVELQPVAAAPRQAQLQANGRVRSRSIAPMIDPLRDGLINLLESNGELLLALNSLRHADHFHQSMKIGRLKRGRIAAQSLIGRFAAIKASGVAINPLIMLDLAGGMACDTALVLQLSKLYGLQMGGKAARELLKKLSIYNAFIGGAQLGIQLTLGILRHLLLLASPITSGLSLAPAAPVAILQAAIAVQTTKRTGRLAAEELLRGSQRKEVQPKAMIQRLASNDPEVSRLLGNWPTTNSRPDFQSQILLP